VSEITPHASAAPSQPNKAPLPTRLTVKSVDLRSPRMLLMGGMGTPGIAERVAEHLGIEVTPTRNRWHENSEVEVRFFDEHSFNGDDVYIIAAADGAPDNPEVEGFSPNDALMEVSGMAQLAKDCGAREVVVGLPVLPYARSDERGGTGRKAMMVRTALQGLTANGVDRMFTLDLHSGPTAGLIPRGDIEVIDPMPTLLPAMKQWAESKDADRITVLSPRANGFKYASRVSKALRELLGAANVQTGMMEIDKHGKLAKTNSGSPVEVGHFADRHVLIVDDMIDSGNVVTTAVKRLEQRGALSAAAAVTHGYFTNNATERLAQQPLLEQIIVTNSIAQHHRGIAYRDDFLKVQDATKALAAKVNQMYLPSEG
jgi:ribose-phosphate pyrophosphokinase